MRRRWLLRGAFWPLTITLVVTVGMHPDFPSLPRPRRPSCGRLRRRARQQAGPRAAPSALAQDLKPFLFRYSILIQVSAHSSPRLASSNNSTAFAGSCPASFRVCPPAVAPGRSRSSVGGFCLLALVLACRCGWPQSALAAGCSPRLRGRWPGASAIGCQFGAARFGGKAMEWFSRNTSIAGFQVPNWGLVLGAIIVILLIYQFMR